MFPGLGDQHRAFSSRVCRMPRGYRLSGTMEVPGWTASSSARALKVPATYALGNTTAQEKTSISVSALGHNPALGRRRLHAS
jgi:hypothetical protein